MASVPKLRVRGLREALLRLDVIADLENAVAVQAVMLEAAKMVTDEVHDNIDARQSDPWKPHEIKIRAGKSIRVETGDLKAAVIHKPIGRNGAVAMIDFYTAPHAWYLEFGFTLRNGGSYPPEAFFGRAVQTMKRPVSAYIKQRMIQLLHQYSVDDPEGLFASRKRVTV